MTHSGGKPHKVGDRGQRYEVHVAGYPNPGDNVIGWSDKLDGAIRMAAAIAKAPGAGAAYIVDRQVDVSGATTTITVRTQ